MKTALQITVRVGLAAVLWRLILLAHQYARRFLTFPDYCDWLITGQSSLLWVFVILTAVKGSEVRNGERSREKVGRKNK